MPELSQSPCETQKTEEHHPEDVEQSLYMCIKDTSLKQGQSINKEQKVQKKY